MSLGRNKLVLGTLRKLQRWIVGGALMAIVSAMGATPADAFYPFPWGRPCRWHGWTGPEGWGYGHPGASFGLMHWRMHRYLNWDAFWEGHPGYEISGMRWDWDDGSNAGRGPDYGAPHGGTVTGDRPLHEMPGYGPPAQQTPKPALPQDPMAGVIDVHAPLDAELFVNGQKTHIHGTQRQFVASNLSPGQSYGYEVRAEYVRGGRRVKEAKRVSLTAGQQVPVAFGEMAHAIVPERKTPRTSLTLHVPEDAKVYLSGVATKSTGAVRTYATSALADGKEFPEYQIRVEVERNGKLISREATISLAAGESRAVAIDLDTPQTEVASR